MPRPGDRDEEATVPVSAPQNFRVTGKVEKQNSGACLGGQRKALGCLAGGGKGREEEFPAQWPTPESLLQAK